MKQRSKVLNLLTVVSLLAALFAACSGGQASSNKIALAFVGTNFTVDGKINPQSEYAGVEMAVKEINRLGGLNGITIDLTAYDDQSDVDQARAYASDIVKSNALAVIGHSTIETSDAAGVIYDEGGILAVNAVPGTEELSQNHFHYYNAAFTVEDQAIYLANYLYKTRGENQVSIIYDDSAYSQALADQFDNTFHGLGGRVRKFNAQGWAAEQVVATIASWGLSSENPESIFIALPPQEASTLVVAIRRSGMKAPLVGANNLGSYEFDQEIAKQGEEKARPGYFTDNILLTRGIIFDSTSDYAARFLKDFQGYYNQEPSDAPMNGYNATLAVLEAIRRASLDTADLQAGQRKATRETIFNQMGFMGAGSNTIEGLNGPIIFDDDGNMVSPIRFGVYSNGNIISALTQYEAIILPANTPNLDELVQNGRVLTVGGNYVYVVNIVYAGVDVIDIRDIDTQKSTYLMDFYLWFRYRPNNDPNFKPDDYVFTNSQDSEPSATLISNIQPPEGDENSLAFVTYRVTATFKNDFDFHAYPFDYQNLVVHFRNQSSDTTYIQYVVDRIGMRDTKADELLNHYTDNGAFRSLLGWQVEEARASQSAFSTTSTMGNPQRFEQKEAARFSVFEINIKVRRIAIEYLVKSLLPLLLTLILAYISFYLPLGHSERFGVGSTALLTTAFFHLNLVTTLPQIGYTVLMEVFFYVAYGLSVLIIVLETTSIHLEKNGEKEANEDKKKVYQRQRERLNLLGRIVYPIIMIGALLFGKMTFDGSISWPLIALTSSRSPVVDIYKLANGAMPKAASPTQTTATKAQVTLKLTSWRPEDTRQIEAILEAFHQFVLSEYQRDIRIEYVPVMSTSYDAILTAQLQNGNAPDLFYVRPFTVNGVMGSYLLPLDDPQTVETLENIYSPEKRQPWQSMWGTYYAVPFVGVVQGIYYNRDIFRKLNLEVPATWEDFVAAAEKLSVAGYVPIANGLNRTEDSEMFMSMVANYVGGKEGRAEYEQGKRCFNDPQVLGAFKALEGIIQYLPVEAATLDSTPAKQLFINQKAAMLFGGSWDVKTFEQAQFDWGVFPAPAPRGRQTQVIFQPDIGMGINRATAHSEDAQLFIQWLMDKRSTPVVTTNLPGFYPLGNVEAGTSPNTHDVEFLSMAADYPTDVRWMFIGISDHYPRASEIIRFALNEMVAQKLPAETAAKRLQDGLAEWYTPAQICR